MTVPPQAAVLAAGIGRRLLPYTRNTPKPLLPLLNVPLLTHTLHGLARAGVRRVVVNAWHLSDALVRHVAENPIPDLDVRVVVEPVLLGTGGGLANLWRELDQDAPLLVMAADVVADFDLAALAAAHRSARAEATMALTARADPARYGAVETDPEGCVVDVAGLRGCSGTRRLVNASAHLLEPSFVARFRIEPSCLVRDGYVPALREGTRVHGWVHPGGWCETGSPDTLLEAQLGALAGRLAVDPALRERGGILRGGALIHPSARVAPDAQVDEGCVIGPRASVGSGAQLSACLLLPGALVGPGVRLRRRIVDAPGVLTGAPLCGEDG